MRKLFFSGIAIASAALMTTWLPSDKGELRLLSSFFADSTKKDTPVYTAFKDLPLKPPERSALIPKKVLG